jgi:hypothetical protein
MMGTLEQHAYHTDPALMQSQVCPSAWINRTITARKGHLKNNTQLNLFKIAIIIIFRI